MGKRIGGWQMKNKTEKALPKSNTGSILDHARALAGMAGNGLIYDRTQSVLQAIQPNNRIAELAIEIIKAKKAYYSGKPIMSDYQYDMIEQELKKLDEKHPVNYYVGYSEEYDWWLDRYGAKE
jgi:hypothetical protein